MKLSVVIPVYNERQTIGRVLPVVCSALPDIEKEILIVDDCSCDGTREWLAENLGDKRGRYTGVNLENDRLCFQAAADGRVPACSFCVLNHNRNLGKGGALRTGLGAVTGEVIVIQDADLEYDPNDWQRMYPLIAERRVADVVYGSRFAGSPHRSLYFHHYLGNRLISLIFNILYNQTLNDVEVCYKMFRREVLDEVRLTCNDFGFEVEISAAIARSRRWRIYEVGISYFGRTYAEGKKINWRDGLKALWYLFWFRL